MIDIKTIAVPKKNANGGGTTIINNISGGGAGGSFEPHYLWGQYFDDTQDINGDLTSNGTIKGQTINAANGYFTGIQGAQGTFTNGVSAQHANVYDIQGVQANFDTFAGHQGFIEGIQGQQANFTQFTGTQGNINNIKGDSLDYTNIKGAQGVITRVNSQYLDVAVSAYIKELLAKDITTENLTVTKAAHFFKLIIDEIKAAKGQIIVTPANATLDLVETISGGWRCYFIANDGNKETHNSFEANDQVICQTFNAATGTSYNVSNTFYWRLCTAASSTPVTKTINGEQVDCHYIDLSSTDQDQYSNAAPAAGDEIVMLGHRNNANKDRQAAIIISAYNSTYLDTEIKAPSIVQYYGINDYNLSNHRKNVISRDKNAFTGDFTVVTGSGDEDILDLINSSTPYIQNGYWYINGESTGVPATGDDGNSPYIGSNGNWWIGNVDTGVPAQGEQGPQGPQGETGPQGRGISGVTEYYLATSASSGVTRDTAGWTTSIPTLTSTNKYLWNYEAISYSSGNPTYTDPAIIGVYGADGRGITGVIEHYLATNASSGVTRSTSGWTTSIQTVTSTNKYLWNYEEITYSTGNPTYTDPVIIGVYGDQGDQGPQGNTGPQGDQGPQGQNGNGISSVTEYYLATSASSGVTRNTSGWTTTIQNITSTKKYLWNYEQITYTSGSSTYTDPAIIGVYGNTGDDGRSITGVIEHYLATSASSGVTRSTSGWTTTIQTVTSTKKYLWNYEEITYSSGNPTYTDAVIIGVYGDKGDKGDQGPKGDDGLGVTNIVEYYLATSRSSGVTNADSGWTTTIQTMTETNRYLWNYEEITYGNGSVLKTQAVIIGTFGAKGNDGRGITSVTNYYLASSQSTGITRSSTGWNTTVPTITPTNKYLWNYEDILYSDNSHEYTACRIIGVYGDKGDPGQNGTNGTSITGVTEYYLATSAGSGVTRNTSGWTTTIQTITSTNKYLWNYEKISYSSGNPTYTDPAIIGVYGDKGNNGDDGRGITSITEYYLASAANSGVTRNTSGWTTTVQTVTSSKRYLWNYEKITYTTGDPTYTDPAIIGVYGDKGDQGDQGNTGNGISSITEYYLATSASSGVTRNTSGWTTTIQTITSTKKYLWNYEDILYTSGSHAYSTPVIIGTYGDKGDPGQNGTNGRGITSITNYYLASPNSTGITRYSTGWNTTVPTITATNKYLWNYEDTLYTDNTHGYTDARIIGVYGDKGETGPQGPNGQTIWDVNAYKLAEVASGKPSVTSNITTSTVDFGNGWKSTPQAPSYTGERISSTTVDNTGLNTSSTAGAMTVWAALDSTDPCYTGLTTNFGEGWKVAKGNDAHSKYVVDRIYFTPKTNSARITFQIGASSESNYDGVLIGNVGAAANTTTNWSSGSGKCTYGKSIYTGTTFNANGVVTVDITVSNKAATQTFIDVIYKKDSSTSSNLDCGYYRIVRSEGVNWVSTATVTNGTVGTGGWSTPIKWQGQDGVDGANGANGAPADYYELEPIVEEAKVIIKNGNTEYPEGTLYVNVSYNIIHVVGDTRTTITPNKTSGYHVKISDSNSGPSSPYNFTINGNAISYTNVTYQQPYHTATSPIQWIKCSIVYGSNHAPVNSNVRYTNVTFEAGAVLSVTDSISATVQGQTESINGLSNNVASLTITSNQIQSKVNRLANGDTNNKWYPACYNSVMQSSDNAFIVTDMLETTDNNPYYWVCQNNNSYGVPIINSTTTIAWMSSSPSGQAIGNTGTVYLYSPYYQSSTTELTYTVTFDYNANNRFYIEVITYNGIAGARTAYKNIKSTSSIKTVNSGSGSYNQWVQNFTVAANTYFRVRIRMNPTGTGTTPTYTFGKFSMYYGNQPAQTFYDWNEAMSTSTSVISQTADSIKLGVEKAGINISTGKITSIANKFEWQNSNGDKILYMDSKGNANFAGTIRAKNFFKTLAVTSTVGHSIIFDPDGVGTSIAYIKETFRCDENEQTYIAGYYYEVPTNAWWDIFYYDQEKVCLCTGSADEVVVIPDGYTSGGTYVVYVPRARDYTGKQITIRHTIVTGYVYIRQCDYTDNLSGPWCFSSDGIHFSSGTDNVTIEPGNRMVNEITAYKSSSGKGEIITLYAIGSGDDAYWVVWRQSL